MVKFVLGRACSGKSTYIVNAAAKDSINDKVIIIVPEQFTFETERAVIRDKNANKENISVMSFTKLYREVSNLCGFGKLPVMSDGERALITDMAIKACSDNLILFSKFANSSDFCLKIADIIRDIKFADISEDDLIKAAMQLKGNLGNKLKDIALILSTYNALITKKFIDPSDYLTRLYELLESCNYFDGAVVYFDSFTGFTGQQYKIIKNIIKNSKDTTFSFCTNDISCKDKNIFYNINEAASKIKTFADELKIPFDAPVVLKDNHYNSDSLALKNLELLLSNGNSEKIVDDGSLKIYSCTSPNEEVYAATSLIKYLVDNKNYRYRDFIVVARNADDYKNHFEVFSEKNGIQCYYDKKVNLCDTVFYIYLNSLIKLNLSYSTENILNFIKCGFNSFDESDIYALEDYCFVWGIKGSDWSKEWIMNPNGLNRSYFKPEDKELLARVNSVREAVDKKLSGFRTAFCGEAKTRAKALYNFIISEGADRYLSQICERYEAENELFAASALRQSWDASMKVLNSIAKLYDGEISSELFAKSFKISCKSINISNVPQTLDEVTFGSADRIRPSKPKVCIILGANQGVFPQISAEGGILSQSDKRKIEAVKLIQENGTMKTISFNDDIIKSSVEENYLVYSMCCCPVDKTIIFYSEKTLSGEQLEPSTFVSKICSDKEGIKIEKVDLFSDEFSPKTTDAAFYLMSSLDDTNFDLVKNSLADIDEYADKIATFSNSEFCDSHTISSETSSKLFTDNISISPSNLDTYHNCKYKFLLQYGLYISKLEKAEINKMKRGNIIHHILENMINTYKKGIISLTEEEIINEIDRLRDEYLEGFVGSDILRTPRFNYLLLKISDATKQMILHLCEEFKQSGFEPKYCEFTISEDGDIPPYEFPLTNGKITLKGKIDRVDFFGDTIRIIDYKSGGKTFKLSQTLYGLNLQMLLYLYVLLNDKSGKFSYPKAGGILYMPGVRDEKKGFAMNGLIVDDDTVIKAMEAEVKGKYIPSKRSKSSFADAETFDLIFENIEKIVKNMGETIKLGELEPNPAENSDWDTACTYCDFKTVCRSSDKNHRKIKNIEFDKIKDYLKGGADDEIQAD